MEAWQVVSLVVGSLGLLIVLLASTVPEPARSGTMAVVYPTIVGVLGSLAEKLRNLPLEDSATM